MRKLRKGDVVVYKLDTCPAAHGSIGIVIRGPYKYVYSKDSEQAVDIEWIAVHPTLAGMDARYNVDCFELLFPLDRK